jgi:MFS family permease
MAGTESRTGIFFGWFVVGTAFLLGMLTGGLHAYSRGIFLKPIAAELDASRTDLSIGFVITTVVAALVSPFMGHLLDRYSLRKIMSIAVIWTALGYLALGMIQSRWQLFITLGLFFGIATFTIGGLGIPKLMIAWFMQRRGLAIAIAAMGASFAGVVAPPITTFLIDSIGWRNSLFCFGALTLVVVLPLVAVIREKPAQMGLYPDNRKPADTQVTGNTEMAANLPLIKRRDFLNKWSFWGLVLIFGTQTGMFQGISIHLFPHLTDIGISEQRTALALSLMATFAMLSKPIFGWMVDHLPPRSGVIISISSEIAALLLFLIADDYVLILVAAILFGFGYGAMNPLRNGLTAMLFGGRNFGSVAGTMRPLMLPLGIAGLPLGGLVFDKFQNYDLMFESFILFYLVSLLGLIPIKAELKKD